MNEELDELFGVPLDEFVATRTAIVKRLKAEGRMEDAAAIAASKKPVVSAWMVNQLARTAATAVAALIEAGESLQGIQRGEGGSYEDARQAENAALVDLRRAATDIDPEVTTATLERMVTSLRAGIASEEGRSLIRTGRLTTDLEASGFDAFAGAVFAPPAQAPPAQPEEPAVDTRRLEELREAARVARTEADDAAEQARRTRADAEHAERLAATARKAADAAEKRATRAEAKASDAADALAQAES